MAKNETSMKVGNSLFKFDFDTGELILTREDRDMSLTLDEAEALGDFLVEVLSTQGYTPQVRPLTITRVEVKTAADQETQDYMEHHYLGGE